MDGVASIVTGHLPHELRITAAPLRVIHEAREPRDFEKIFLVEGMP
jgi:hypothetical protein